MKHQLFILFIPILFLSCKKDKLKDEKSIFIGKWNWKYSVYYYDQCNPPTQSKVLTPATENKTASIEFLKKGYVIFNGTDKKRIVFENWLYKNVGSGQKYSFDIKLDNKKDQWLGGFIGGDTLILEGEYKGEAFDNSSCSDGCCNYTNYYIRQ